MKRRLRVLMTAAVVTTTTIWGLADARAPGAVVPSTCGYVAFNIPNVTGTTILLPTTTSGQATCTAPPCGDIDHRTSSSEPQVAFDVFVCVDNLP